MLAPILRSVAVSAPCSLIVLTLWACSSDDGGGPAPSDGRDDASTRAPSDSGGGPASDAGIGADAAQSADADAAAGRGMTVTVDGTEHDLTVNPRASKAGNGYAIQAGKVDGTSLYGATVLLVKATTNGNSTEYVEPTPGVYGCSASVPTAPYLWARIQYTSPDGTFQYGEGAACVTLTSFGAMGQPVVGTFTSSLSRVSGNGPNSVQVSGTFDVDRTN